MADKITNHAYREPTAIGMAPDRCVTCDRYRSEHEFQEEADAEAQREERPMMPGFDFDALPPANRR